MGSTLVVQYFVSAFRDSLGSILVLQYFVYACIFEVHVEQAEAKVLGR